MRGNRLASLRCHWRDEMRCLERESTCIVNIILTTNNNLIDALYLSIMYIENVFDF